MKRLFYLLFFVSFISFSQIRYYRINYTNLPQSIELTENNGVIKGIIITKLDKGSWNINCFNRSWRKFWKIKPKGITIINQINEEVSKDLMLQLKSDGIETIKNCKDDLNCENINFLDGSSTSFKIKTEKIDREYYFSEIYPISKDHIETNEIRKQAQNIITTMNQFINLKENFSNVIKQLPSGKYYYFNGNSICQINHKKNKL